MKIRNLMTRRVTCISPTDSLRQAFDLMQDEEIRHLPVVVENNHLVGILSERDILLRAGEEEGEVVVPDIDAGNIMTTELYTCQPNDNLRDVAAAMVERKIDAMPVTDGSGELLGIITASDFVDLIAQDYGYVPESMRALPFNFTVNRYSPEARAGARGLRPRMVD